MDDLPTLLIATRNEHKSQEIAKMLEGIYQVHDLNGSQFPEIEETGTTFLQNASLKAVGISKLTEGIVLSDDSGLEVDALNGMPGVYSSSFGGEEGNHAKNNERLILELAKLDAQCNRTARFRCVMVLAEKGNVLAHFEGEVSGRIIDEKQGVGGFGYDPLFIPDGYSKTFAELGSEVKNSLSHRAKALAKVLGHLKFRE
jgi:XTP/dITP diphosphohydrolase